MPLTYDTLFVGGRWVRPTGSSTITAVSASTEEVLGSAPRATEAEVDAAVAAARAASDDPGGWAGWAPARRAEALERLAAALERRAAEIARRVSSQNGLPITISQQVEGAFPAMLIRYYAEMIRDRDPEEVRP
ncbi:aldehyde dehydrogenase family protein, partial [Mycobacterium sp.]|uniref:aldehyde dehydrogenase family protein n=1 Tax=Mycobacterium sp. TaxID=1785 RepID=UPI00126E708E